MKFEWSSINHLFQNSVRVIVGSLLVAFGVIGLFLPFIQGVLLIVLGLTLLGVKFVKNWLRLPK